MPKRDALILLALGIFLFSFAFFKQMMPISSAIGDQSPINPEKISGNFDYADRVGEFNGQEVVSEEIPDQEPTVVLGENNDNKRIEVDLTNQRVYAYEGDTKVFDFLISSGKWGRTPTGTFRIWGKFRYTKMSGGSKERNTYYYLPNVPYVMFFSNDQIAASRGFSLHGTYWHENFGTPMSHGCINMKTEEAGLLYEWAAPHLGDKKSGRASDDNPGTEVIIYGEAPAS